MFPVSARLLGVMAVLVLSSCGGAVAGPSGTPSPAASTDHWAREAQSPYPARDTGYVVQITAGGARPNDLYVPCCGGQVTWVNLSGQEVSVAFDHELVKSGPIPPGGKYMWKSDTPVSITYHVSNSPDMAHLQIGGNFND